MKVPRKSDEKKKERGRTNFRRIKFSSSLSASQTSVSTNQLYIKWYYDQKITSFLLPILKACSLNTQLAKFSALSFIRRLFVLIVSFGFGGPPLLTFKTDRRLDLEKMTSFTH